MSRSWRAEGMCLMELGGCIDRWDTLKAATYLYRFCYRQILSLECEHGCLIFRTPGTTLAPAHLTIVDLLQELCVVCCVWLRVAGHDINMHAGKAKVNEWGKVLRSIVACRALRFAAFYWVELGSFLPWPEAIVCCKSCPVSCGPALKCTWLASRMRPNYCGNLQRNGVKPD